MSGATIGWIILGLIVLVVVVVLVFWLLSFVGGGEGSSFRARRPEVVINGPLVLPIIPK
jgi:hypothetical protein